MKSPVSKEQLKLQDQLIIACKQGDEKAVRALLQQGAKPNMADAKGEQPLSAAVWGMCPDVVNALLKCASGVTPMTWEECEKHNVEHYDEMFIISKFSPVFFSEWYKLLLKMGSNPFIREFHLQQADKQWHNSNTFSWDNLKSYVESKKERWWGKSAINEREDMKASDNFCYYTEERFESFRTQIKQSIVSAIQPIKSAQKQFQTPESTSLLPSMSHTIPQTLMPGPKLKISPHQLALQGQLIVACKQGDAKAVAMFLKQGAQPDCADIKREYPLAAAVWGMCPDVINALLTAANGVAPMTWLGCEQHNSIHYQGVFIIPKFGPRTYREWYQLLLKIDSNPFLQTLHLKQAQELYPKNTGTASWEDWKTWIAEATLSDKYSFPWGDTPWARTESVFESLRSQIKLGIETAKQPTLQTFFMKFSFS